MQNLKQFFPSKSETFFVYSVIVFWCYSWAVLVFLFNLPSWILKVTCSEILGYFSYGMLFVFIDTLLILTILLTFSVILPVSWFRKDFVVSGTLIASSIFFWILFFQMSLNLLVQVSLANNLAIILVAIVTLVLSLVLTRRFGKIRKAILWFSSATDVFVYIYGFLTLIGSVIILIRNIF